MNATSAPRWIYLSPHLDDAVLSAGGLIFDQSRRGEPVEIWTIMCGLPADLTLSDFAREMHAKWGTTGIAETVALRREEDLTAAAVVGAKAVHFDFADAIYRRDSSGAPLHGDPIDAPLHSADEALPAQIADALRPLLTPQDRFVCQLAVGNHVDHLIVRRAAEMLGRPLLYVADIPYSLWHPRALEDQTMGMRAELHPVSARGLEYWLQAIACYRSQLTSLYESWEALQSAIRDFRTAHGGIRLWQSGPSAGSGP